MILEIMILFQQSMVLLSLRTKFEVEVRLLTSRDENELAAKMQANKK